MAILELEDVIVMYRDKCNKYNPEQLTEKFKDFLYKEALREAQTMNMLNMSMMGCV